MNYIEIENLKFKVLFSEETIKTKCLEFGHKISQDYVGKNPLFICVLNGSFIFFADLLREVSIPHELDFIKLESYGNSMKSSGEINFTKKFNSELFNRHVVVVEDIVDSGLSVDFIKNEILNYKPASLKFLTLLKKSNSIKVDNKIDYVGFEIEDDFVIGYGMDYKQQYRNLKQIYQLINKNG